MPLLNSMLSFVLSRLHSHTLNMGHIHAHTIQLLQLILAASSPCLILSSLAHFCMNTVHVNCGPLSIGSIAVLHALSLSLPFSLFAYLKRDTYIRTHNHMVRAFNAVVFAFVRLVRVHVALRLYCDLCVCVVYGYDAHARALVWL